MRDMVEAYLTRPDSAIKEDACHLMSAGDILSKCADPIVRNEGDIIFLQGKILLQLLDVPREKRSTVLAGLRAGALARSA